MQTGTLNPSPVCRLFLPVILVSLLAGCNTREGERDQSIRPNILWITCEDISPALGCYGDTYAFTPVLDRLAEEGVRYTRACAPAPICSPSRSTLITGVYATTLGTQHLRSDIPVPEGFRTLPQYLSEAGYFCSNNQKTDYNFNPEGRWDDQGGNAHWRNRGEGQPFFSVFNFGVTHEGPANNLRNEDVAILEERHDPDRAVLPPYYPDTPEMRRIWAHQYDLISVMDRQVGELIAQLKEDGLYDSTIIFFFSDHGFGLPRYKRWLCNSGLQVPMIIRVPETYRDLMPGKPGTAEDRLVSFVDLAPSMLNLAGLEVPAHMAGEVFLGPDSGEEREYLYGSRSRADDIYEVSRCVMDRQYIYIRHYLPHRSYVTDAIIFGDQKASYRELSRLRKEGSLNEEAAQFWQPKGYEELYDLENDPFELKNLAGDPAFSEVAGRMREALYDWMVAQRDIGLLNEAEMMLRSGGTTPYEMGASPEYAVRDILAAANRCGHPSTTVEEAAGMMDHPDAGVRFWGVMALQAMGEEGAAGADRLRARLEDSSPSVAILAAETLCHLDLCDEALPVIGKYLHWEGHPTVVLQAAISARRIGEKARPLVPVIGEVFPEHRGDVWGRYRDWIYSMFTGFALDQVYLNCGLVIPE